MTRTDTTSEEKVILHTNRKHDSDSGKNPNKLVKCFAPRLCQAQNNYVTLYDCGWMKRTPNILLTKCCTKLRIQKF